MGNELKQKIINYYDNTYWDYKISWGISRHYGIHYGFHDIKHQKHDEAILNMNRVMAEMSGVNSQSVILDAGCGIGGSAIWLAKNFGTKVIGITLSEKQCNIAKTLAEKNKIDYLSQFFVRDFISTGFPDESFDIVWAIESFCYAENKYDFLVEAKRILKRGGRLIVADFFLTKPIVENFLDDKKLLEEWMNGWIIPNLITQIKLKNYFKKIGFQNIQIKNINQNILPSAKRMYLLSQLFKIFQFARSLGENLSQIFLSMIKKHYLIEKVFRFIGIESFLERIYLWSKIRSANAAASILQYLTLKKGLWFYGIFLVEK
jgi:tocopherol O-methyltransferase